MEMCDVILNIRRRTMAVLNQEVSLERVITRTGARLVLANVQKCYIHRARIKPTNANSVVELKWLFNVTINDISVIYVTAHRCAGGPKKKLDLRSGSHAIDIS